MSSISVSDYRQACADLIKTALKYPHMYFATLGEFETFLRGYDAAYGQILSLDRNELFNNQFSDWLREHLGLSCASGWSIAIEGKFLGLDKNCVEVFEKYVNLFFENWG